MRFLVPAPTMSLVQGSQRSVRTLYNPTYSIFSTDYLDKLPRLTTIYQPRSECLGRYVSQAGPEGPLAYSASAWDDNWIKCQPYAVMPTYSPGVCPGGQTLATLTEMQKTRSAGAAETLWFGICCDRYTTHISNHDHSTKRCHSAMTYNATGVYSTLSFFCVRSITSLQPVVALQSFSVQLTGPFTRTGPDEQPSSTTDVLTWWSTVNGETSAYSSPISLTQGMVVAEPVSVFWHQADLSAFPTEYVASLVQTWGVPGPTASSSASPASTSQLPKETGQSNPTHLSTGAKAGIGVGAAVGAILLASLLIFLLLRRRHKTVGAGNTRGDSTRHEMEDQDQTLAKKKWFLGGKWRSETHATKEPVELDSRPVHVVPGPPKELDTPAFSSHA